MITREKKEMSSTSALPTRLLPRPSPRQARRIRQHLRETQPEVHAQLKALRRETRADKVWRLAQQVNHCRWLWMKRREKEGKSTDAWRFPGEFTPPPRRSRKWFKHFLRRSKGNTRTISLKMRFKRWVASEHPLHQCRKVDMSPRTGCYAQVREREKR